MSLVALKSFSSGMPCHGWGLRKRVGATSSPPVKITASTPLIILWALVPCQVSSLMTSAYFWRSTSLESKYQDFRTLSSYSKSSGRTWSRNTGSTPRILRASATLPMNSEEKSALQAMPTRSFFGVKLQRERTIRMARTSLVTGNLSFIVIQCYFHKDN